MKHAAGARRWFAGVAALLVAFAWVPAVAAVHAADAEGTHAAWERHATIDHAVTGASSWAHRATRRASESAAVTGVDRPSASRTAGVVVDVPVDPDVVGALRQVTVRGPPVG